MGKKAYRLPGGGTLRVGMTFPSRFEQRVEELPQPRQLRYTANTTTFYTHLLYRGLMGVIRPADHL
jgi:hypothetical protein